MYNNSNKERSESKGSIFACCSSKKKKISQKEKINEETKNQGIINDSNHSEEKKIKSHNQSKSKVVNDYSPPLVMKKRDKDSIQKQSNNGEINENQKNEQLDQLERMEENNNNDNNANKNDLIDKDNNLQENISTGKIRTSVKRKTLTIDVPKIEENKNSDIKDINLTINSKNKDKIIHKNDDSIEDPEIEDEYQENDQLSMYNQSVISNNVLRHINKPKLFNDAKIELASNYSRSEYSRLDSFVSGQNRIFGYFKPLQGEIKTSNEFTEFDIADENHERIQHYLETPHIGDANGMSFNPNFKMLFEKIIKKDNRIKEITDKTNIIMNLIKNYQDENKTLNNKIEREIAENERLMHILNFLNTGN